MAAEGSLEAFDRRAISRLRESSAGFTVVADVEIDSGAAESVGITRTFEVIALLQRLDKALARLAVASPRVMAIVHNRDSEFSVSLVRLRFTRTEDKDADVLGRFLIGQWHQVFDPQGGYPRLVYALYWSPVSADAGTNLLYGSFDRR